MVNEEYEDVVLDRRPQHFATSCCLLITHHDCHEGLSIQLVFSVIEDIGIVHVVTIGVVKNLAREWVFLSSGNIVTGHEDDLIGVHTLFNEDLVSVESISLVPVIVITTATRNDYGPVFCS